MQFSSVIFIEVQFCAEQTGTDGNGRKQTGTDGNGQFIKNSVPIRSIFKIKMAPAVGFEPTTKWLTATYSTAELCRSV